MKVGTVHLSDDLSSKEIGGAPLLNSFGIKLIVHFLVVLAQVT